MVFPKKNERGSPHFPTMDDLNVCVGVVCTRKPPLENLSEEYIQLRISADGLRLFHVSSTHQRLRVYDLSHPSFDTCDTWLLGDGAYQVMTFAVSGDGETVFTGSGNDQDIKEWRDDVLVRTLTGHNGPVCTLCLSRDGSILYSGSVWGEIRVWDVGGTGNCAAVLRKHQRSITGLVCTPDAQILCSGSSDGTAIVWKKDACGVYQFVLTLPSDYADTVISVALSPTHALLVFYDNGDIHEWTLENTQQGWYALRPWTKDDYYMTSLCVQDNTLVAVDGSGMFRLWNLSHHPRAQVFGTNHDIEVRATHENAIALTPDGKYLFHGNPQGHITQWLLLDARTLSEATDTVLHPDLCGILLAYVQASFT